MDIDDDEIDQAPSSSTGLKGDKKRFEVKKVRENKFHQLEGFRDDSQKKKENNGKLEKFLPISLTKK